MIRNGSIPASQRSQYVLTDAQIQELLLHEMELRNRIIIELFVYCGLRRAECATLEIARLHLDENRIEVMGKGYHGRGKPRLMPIPPFLADKLRKWIGKRKTGYVFPGRDGPHLTSRAIQDVLTAAGRRVGFRQVAPGLKNLTCHMLRHTFARRLKAQKFDMEDIALLLGHENIFKTVQMYGTKTFAEVEAEVKKKLFV